MQFLGYVRRAQGQKIAAVLHDDSGALARILNAIQHDERFDPYRSMDDIITLPARLEGSRTGQHPEVSPMRRLLMGLGLLVLVALILFIFGRH